MHRTTRTAQDTLGSPWSCSPCRKRAGKGVANATTYARMHMANMARAIRIALAKIYTEIDGTWPNGSMHSRA